MWDFTNNLQFLFKEVQKNAAMSSQNRSKYQGNDSHQFDEDVHCRSEVSLNGSPTVSPVTAAL